MYQVHDEHQNERIEGDWSFCVNVLQERNNGQEIFEFRITCSQASIMHEVREGLEGMCAKARDIRQKEQQRQGATGVGKSEWRHGTGNGWPLAAKGADTKENKRTTDEQMVKIQLTFS